MTRTLIAPIEIATMDEGKQNPKPPDQHGPQLPVDMEDVVEAAMTFVGEGGMSREDFDDKLGPKRVREARRWVAWYALRYMEWSSREIGDFLKVNHANVLRAAQIVEEESDFERQYKFLIQVADLASNHKRSPNDAM